MHHFSVFCNVLTLQKCLHTESAVLVMLVIV